MADLRLLRETVYSTSYSMVTRKGSPYMQSLNKMIGRVRDTGLFVYWEDRTVRRYMPNRQQEAVLASRMPTNPGPTELQVSNISVSSSKLYSILCIYYNNQGPDFEELKIS